MLSSDFRDVESRERSCHHSCFTAKQNALSSDEICTSSFVMDLLFPAPGPRMWVCFLWCLNHAQETVSSVLGSVLFSFCRMNSFPLQLWPSPSTRSYWAALWQASSSPLLSSLTTSFVELLSKAVLKWFFFFGGVNLPNPSWQPSPSGVICLLLVLKNGVLNWKPTHNFDIQENDFHNLSPLNCTQEQTFYVRTAAELGEDQVFIEMPNFCTLVDAVFRYTSFVWVLEMAGSFGQQSWMKSYTGVSQMTLFTLVSPIPSSFPRCFHIKYILYWKRDAAKGGLLRLLANDDETKAQGCVNVNSRSIPAPKRAVSLADAASAFFKWEGSFWKWICCGEKPIRGAV